MLAVVVVFVVEGCCSKLLRIVENDLFGDTPAVLGLNTVLVDEVAYFVVNYFPVCNF
jgi:hypothetical protein